MIRIAIADDHTLFAKGIEGLLEEHEDLEVLGLFSNGKELVDFLEISEVDVVLTDLNMPILNGFGVLSAVKNGNSQTKVVVLSMYDEDKIYRESLEKGAAG